MQAVEKGEGENDITPVRSWVTPLSSAHSRICPNDNMICSDGGQTLDARATPRVGAHNVQVKGVLGEILSFAMCNCFVAETLERLMYHAQHSFASTAMVWVWAQRRVMQIAFDFIKHKTVSLRRNKVFMFKNNGLCQKRQTSTQHRCCSLALFSNS